MKERIKNLYQFILLCLVTATLSACGGSSTDESANYSISANTSKVTFSNEFLQISQDSFQIDITFTGNGLLVGFAPDSQGAGWLNYRTENVTATSAILHIDVVNAENIIANLYNTKLRLSTGDIGNVNLVHHDIDVSLLVWQLTTNTDLVSFRGTLGDLTIPTQSFDLISENNKWTAETNVDWLSLDIVEGTGDASITLTPDISLLDESQLYSANITLTEVTTGDSKNISVELGLDDIRLAASYAALAFNSLVTQNKLTHTVSIINNGINHISWQASSNVDWLTLTEDIVTNELTITADPSILTSNGLYHAEITLSAANAGAALQGTININLNKGDFDSEEVIVNEVIKNNSGAVLDPLRPYLYIAQGDAISVYNIMSGAIIKTISSPLIGLNLTNLVIHPDGSLLLASNLETYLDGQDVEQTRVNHYQVSLPDFTIEQLDQEKVTIVNRPEAIVMVSGKPVVITQAQEVADMSLTRHYVDNQNAFFSATVNDVKTNDLVQIFDATSSSIKQYQLSYNAYASQTTAIDSSTSYENALFGDSMTSMTSNNDGSIIYTANINSEWSTYDGELFSDQGLLHNEPILGTFAIHTDSTNNSYFYRFNSTSGFTFSKYNENQQLLWETIHTNGSTDIYIAPDYQRLISYDAATSILAFDAIP